VLSAWAALDVGRRCATQADQQQAVIAPKARTQAAHLEASRATLVVHERIGAAGHVSIKGSCQRHALLAKARPALVLDRVADARVEHSELASAGTQGTHGATPEA
jgi:hypothetical protein